MNRGRREARQFPFVGSVIESLQAKLNDLSRSQKIVALFVLSHLDEAVFLTAAKLAKRSRTSESTVIRLARTLGYQGFPELQEHLQAMVRQSLAPIERMRQARKVGKEYDSILERATEAAVTNIRESRKLAEPLVLEQAGKALTEADSKYLVGLRASSGIAIMLGSYLKMILPRVHILTNEASALFEELVSLERNDVVVAVSFPRYTRWTVECLRYARDRGTRTIAITDSPLSPAAQIADIPLVGKGHAVTFNNSYVAAALIVDALIAMVVSLAPEQSLARLQAGEQALRGHDFFYIDERSSGSEDT